MSFQVLAPEARPCVWMSAGLISYRLCDRGFDCESCPLDAALRGHLEAGSTGRTQLDRRVAEGLFPADRLYTAGHLWVQALSDAEASVWRLGLDAFAAAIVGCITAVRCLRPGTAVYRGERLCEVDLGLGALPLASPVSGRILRSNPDLDLDPRRVVTEPYEGGWMVEIEGLDPGAVLRLRPAAATTQETVHDLRQFRRSLALRLLTASSADGHSLDDGSLRDLRQLLCGGYADLLAEFVH